MSIAFLMLRHGYRNPKNINDYFFSIIVDLFSKFLHNIYVGTGRAEVKPTEGSQEPGEVGSQVYSASCA